MTTPYIPLALHLTPAEGYARILYLTFVVLLGSALLALSAKVQVPFWPVPMTMQVYVVLIVGMALGVRLGTATVLLYLAEGALGLPVFAGTPERGLGLAYMVGPTGGYLVGFVLAAALVGHLSERGWDRGITTTFVAAFLGTSVIYTCGVAWLATLIGLPKAISAGVLPFLLGDGLKILLATATMPLAWKSVRHPRLNRD